MTITTLDGLVAGLTAGLKSTYQKDSAISQTSGRVMNLFRVGGQPAAGSNASTGAGNTCTNSTSGALPIPTPGGGQSIYLATAGCTSTLTASIVLYDRLVEARGLSGTTTTAQTINSTALPSRATGGANVELWLECYTDLGATPSATVTASYTNQAGTAGQTATLLRSGIPATLRAGQMVPFGLASGDTGVRSVESLTSTTSTGTAGDYGVTLLRRILTIPVAAASATALGWGDINLPVIDSAACLAVMFINSSTSTSAFTAEFGFAVG